MVLSTSLLIAYENMAFDARQYQKKYKRLMKTLSLPYKTNKRQLIEAKSQGLNDVTYNRLIPQLQHQSNRDDSLEMLAMNTSLKIILTEDKAAKLPYVFYRSSFLSNELSISLKADDSRTDLVKYLQILCASATKITICDNYFAQGWDNHKLKIEYVETPRVITVTKNSSKMNERFMHSICKEWSISESTKYRGSHDRYLLIESPQGDIEVMLSSGFDHIWKSRPKEITCVIREM